MVMGLSLFSWMPDGDEPTLTKIKIELWLMLTQSLDRNDSKAA
jgi:hypothetical protein